MGSINILDMALRAAKTDEQKREIVLKYLERQCDPEDGKIVQDFPEGLEWFNTKQPLSLHRDLRGKLVVLDFFTYCCINCMHILPDLELLEERFPVSDGLIVVGVHSAKFENEKSSANVLNAVLRYDIAHAVVNDQEAVLWNALDVQCWPTLVLVGPSGEYLLPIIGEGNRKKMLLICEVALEFFKSRGEIAANAELPMLTRLKDTLPESPLLFPGKIEVDGQGNDLAVADSGHHRILVTTREGVVLYCIGGTEKGFVDGSFPEARFHSPQGMVWKDHIIYVADTENHAIRKIDLKAQTVSTIAGTGVMGDHKCQWGGAPGPEQVLSSPWDVCLGGLDDSILFIAMAGSHQIWGLFLKESKWLKNKSEHNAGVCMLYAGSGNEENRNNAYPRKASFAQPSGLVNPHVDYLSCMYVADSESSSIRSVSLKDGAVKGVVGGELDPMNLFAFGDVDGAGRDAKLQHPLGLAWNPLVQHLYVADSYNHKIKVVDPVKKSCVTVAGSGKPGKVDGSILSEVEFNEPGGLCISPTFRKLYVADTNNNAIRVWDLEERKVKELKIIFPSTSEAPVSELDSLSISDQPIKPLVPSSTPATSHPLLDVTPEGAVCIQLTVKLPSDCALTEGAPTAWMAYIKDTAHLVFGKRPISSLDTPLLHRWTAPPSAIEKDATLRIEVAVCFCESASGTCHMTGLAFESPLRMAPSGREGDANLTIKHEMCLEKNS
ncbi:NHL repeat-containing protein 2-like [Patiria miniata]|uniref:Thioredoxin-like fold domain-containing protein n=1 Tax=Patiria miniata TaxID=46514 RepID=A0A914B5G9_PATMI|nr:NHL repeat-containing protein 2-like [Patiria miniata]